MRKSFVAFAMAVLVGGSLTLGIASNAFAADPHVVSTAPQHQSGVQRAAKTGQLPAATGRELYDFHFFVSHDNAPLYSPAYRVFNELHRCFNCSFPVPGAPAEFPAFGQHLPLRPCAFGICQDAPVAAQPYDPSNVIRLIALPGHFDGEGSTVDFTFFNNVSGPGQGLLMLRVQAHVTNPSLPDEVNKHFAEAEWQLFADQLGNNLFGHPDKRA